MRKRILSILVSVSMALLLVPAVPFTATAEGTAEDAAGGTPSVTTFATKDQLMTSFSSQDPTNIGKVVFGKNDQGKPQEWFVMGKNESVEGDNAILFAASPIKTDVKFFDNPTADISYDSSLGCDYTHSINYKDGVSFKYVYPNHYGMSDLRKTLRVIAEDSSFFAQEEQSMMNSTPITTLDERPHRVEDMDGEKVDAKLSYVVADKLYVPGRYTLFVIDKLEVGTRPESMGGEYRVDPAYWNGGGEFWTRSPDLRSPMASTHAAMCTANGASNQFRSQYVNAPSVDARPAGNLNLGNVLFASAAEASADGVTAGTIASGKAMTLRMDGRDKRVGSATYDPDSGVIVADLNAFAGDPVSLVVQGKDGGRDWYYSQRLYLSLLGGTQVTAAQIKAATGASSVDLSKCKIWVENTDANARMTYAVPAEPARIDVKTIDSVELTGMTPTGNKDLPTRVTCKPESVFVTESGVTYTTSVDGHDAAATGTATWNTTYKGKVTLSAVALAENRYAFASSVTATVDGKKLDAAFSPDKGGSLTVTCEFTTPKRCAITGIAVAPSAPDNNTFSTYYGFDGYKALPTDGDELGSTASVAVLDRQDNSTQNVNMPVTWSFVGGYERSPGASNKLAWTIPASELADYDATSCPGYDAATGGISGTLELRNKEATPVSITDSGASRYFVFQSFSTTVDATALFDIDPNAGAAQYYLSEGTEGGASLANNGTLTVTEPGAYSVNVVTAENGVYAAGYASALVWVVEPFKDLDFDGATYGYAPDAPQSVTFTNLSGSYAITNIEATSRYFKVSGLPTDSSLAPGQTAELSVKPKDDLDAGTYSEVIVIHASSAGDYGYDSYITASFTVNKADIAPAVTIGDWTYGNNPAEADVSGNPGGGSVTFFHKPQGAADSAYTAGLPVDAGSYTLKAAVAETENYLGGEATCDFKINKAGAAVSAAPSTKSGLSYTGLPQALVSAGTASGGTMEYSLDGVEWSSVVSTATKVGSYTVSYRVAGDANHYDAAGGTVSASIAVAKTAIGLSASASSLTGGGTVTLTVNTSWLPAGADYKLVCMDSEVAFSVTGQDAYSVTLPNKTQRYAFRAYCAETDNYTGSQSDHVYVEVTRYDPPVPPTIDLPVTAGGSGGILAGGQLVGSKIVVSNIAQGTIERVLESQDNGQGALKLDLTGLGAPVTSAQLSKPTVGGLVKAAGTAGKNVESVTIAMDGGSIELDRQALSSVEQQMGDDIEVGLEEKGAGELNSAQQQALAKYGEMTKCVEASIKSSRSAIHSFGGGTVRISVSFKPAEGADPARYKVVYVAEDGSVEYHDAVFKDGTLSFSTSHLSTYAIVYIEPEEETLALAKALGELPEAEKLKTSQANAAVWKAEDALAEYAALDDGQKMLVDEALVANAEIVVKRGNELVATADKKAVSKVKDKAFSVKAGSSKSIYFKTKASAAGTKVTYKKTKGSKYITVTKSGKVTAKKGMKAGKKYTAKVKVTCGKSWKYVKVAVKVKK